RPADEAHINEQQACQLAARRTGLDESKLKLEGSTSGFWVFGSSGNTGWLRRGWRGVIVVDVHGAIRCTAQDARAFYGSVTDVKPQLQRELLANQATMLDALPVVTIIRGNRLIRLAQQTEPLLLVAAANNTLDETAPDECVIAIVER